MAALTGIVVAWTLAAGGLFVMNAAITGEFNYQGGDRKTFYSYIGFPFANDAGDLRQHRPARSGSRPCCRAACWRRGTRSQSSGTTSATSSLGRSSGLLPYFFPGVLSGCCSWRRGGVSAWQWLALATIAGAMVMLLVLTPFTYSGGGGPVGNRYFLSFYPLFLLLTPPLAGAPARRWSRWRSARCSPPRSC